MNNIFPEVKKNFGFGCMRLPMIEKEVDTVEFSKMVDTFLENGFNYFDTAHVYISGKSELALKECLTSKYDRSSYILTDKLSGSNFKSEEELEAMIQRKRESGEYAYENRVKGTHFMVEQAKKFLSENMGMESTYIFLHEHKEK